VARATAAAIHSTDLGVPCSVPFTTSEITCSLKLLLVLRQLPFSSCAGSSSPASAAEGAPCQPCLISSPSSQ
jgi:hypothetical protein